MAGSTGAKDGPRLGLPSVANLSRTWITNVIACLVIVSHRMDDNKGIGIPAFIGIYIVSVILFVPGLILCLGAQGALWDTLGYSSVLSWPSCSFLAAITGTLDCSSLAPLRPFVPFGLIRRLGAPCSQHAHATNGAKADTSTNRAPQHDPCTMRSTAVARHAAATPTRRHQRAAARSVQPGPCRSTWAAFPVTFDGIPG